MGEIIRRGSPSYDEMAAIILCGDVRGLRRRSVIVGVRRRGRHESGFAERRKVPIDVPGLNRERVRGRLIERGKDG